MPIWNQQTGTAHTGATLTADINNIPRQPLQMTARVPTEVRGVIGESVLVDTKQGKIDIVDPRPRGAPPSRTEGGDYKTFALPILHYPDLVQITPEEVTGRRAFGSETAYELPQERLTEKLTEQKLKYELTWEYGLVQSAFGRIADKEGNVVLDLTSGPYQDLAPTQATIDLTDPTLDPVVYFRKKKAQQQAKVFGNIVNRWVVYATAELFEGVVGLPLFRDNWKRYQDGAMLRDETDIMINGVPMGAGVELVNYEQVTLSNGHTIFPEDEMIMVPIFNHSAKRRFGSARGMTTSNQQAGQPIHMTTYDLPHDAGVENLTQSNFVTWWPWLNANLRIELGEAEEE